jgi:hypothetical protein
MTPRREAAGLTGALGRAVRGASTAELAALVDRVNSGSLHPFVASMVECALAYAYDDCPGCGGRFRQNARGTRRWCTDACRQRHRYRARATAGLCVRCGHLTDGDGRVCVVCTRTVTS